MSITCSDLRFAWPGGEVVLDGIDLAVGPGRTGLIGANGCGKSTLLKVIAGELRPDGGAVHVTGEIGYLPQEASPGVDRRVDEVLGIAAIRAAVAAIEAGDAAEENFGIVGGYWDVADRARAVLDRLGLEHVELDRAVGELSGGESVLLGLAGELLREPNVLLLDEPTNNLDFEARQRLHEVVASWRGVLLVVSHDRELLELVDEIADLREGGIQCHGGTLSDYERAVAVEQEAAQRAVRAGEADLRRQRRDLVDAKTTLDRRRRYGKKMHDSKREPKIVMGERKRAAQESAGKHRIMHEQRLERAEERLAEAQEAVREDDEIRVDLPDTLVASGRRIVRLSEVRLRCGPEVSLDVRGPERIALMGRNGVGKSTLLRTVDGSEAPVSGEVALRVPARHLPQRLDLLDDDLTVVDNVAAFAPSASPNAVRAKLARFLFRGRQSDVPAGALSGGERFRATLAALLLAEPAPQLLMLDEPTNNLDMASARQLSTALASYRGALLVVSHDLPFLRDLELTRWVRLEQHALVDIDPL